MTEFKEMPLYAQVFVVVLLLIILGYLFWEYLVKWFNQNWIWITTLLAVIFLLVGVIIGTTFLKSKKHK